MSAPQRITQFLALRRDTSFLLVALVLALTGERLWLGFAPKYLETLGAGVFIIGLFDARQTSLGACLWSISPQANFLGAALCGGLGTLWFWRFVYRPGQLAPPVVPT